MIGINSAERITVDEEAILRSWLGGNDIYEIAKARKVGHPELVRLLSDLCDHNRDLGRYVLHSGRRPAGVNGADPAPVADLKARLRAAEQQVVDLTKQLGQARAALHDSEQDRNRLSNQVRSARDAAQDARVQLDELHRRPAPLVEYGTRWCSRCRWVADDNHRHQPLQPVTMAILPRETP